MAVLKVTGQCGAWVQKELLVICPKKCAKKWMSHFRIGGGERLILRRGWWTSDFTKGVVNVWGGDRLRWWTSGVVNVWGGERLGWWMCGWWASYIRLIIMLAEILFAEIQYFGQTYNMCLFWANNRNVTLFWETLFGWKSVKLGGSLPPNL